ncbi:hypothetical protein EUX98_g461 [Antrodiella citrinella]|uniref:AMP-activated protein kinase glycogen-binding domain-containing protein n=1 Tax=Antrodiella citrinella TaxID=2447956 RepID=A0A4S4N442_9APHY|nr:hypothetical protein EUX98_g461 [Antrodiella citrinella]
MSDSDLHEALFKWPHSEPNDVIVTGSFDSWSRTIHLARTPSGFAGTVKIPWGQKVVYKYLVDGMWTTTDTQPTELDPIGNINNVYNAPARPIQPKTQEPPAVLAPSAVTPTPIQPEPTSQTNGVIAAAKETAVGIAEAIAPGTTEKSEPADVSTSPSEPTAVESVVTAVQNAATSASETTAIAASAAVSAVTAAVQAVSNAVSKASSLLNFPLHSSSEPAKPEVGQEYAPESVLPSSAESNPVAPDVPVSILPLNVNSDVPTTNGDTSSKVPETTVVEGAASSEDAPAVPAKEVSTHAPIIVNGQATTSKPTAVILPPVTSSEIPTTSVTPAPNGASNKAETESAPAADAPTLSKAGSTNGHSKRMNFPTLGRNHRHSSSAGSQSEHSETSSATNTVASRVNSQRKQRKSSFFGKIKDLFHHDHPHKEALSK